MLERKQQLRRVDKKKPVEIAKVVRDPRRDAFFRRFAQTRDAFYDVYQKYPKILDFVLKKLDFWSDRVVVEVSVNVRSPAVYLKIKDYGNIINNLGGENKTLNIPSIGRVLFIYTKERPQDPEFDLPDVKEYYNHEKAHSITGSYFGDEYYWNLTKYMTPNGFNLTQKKFKSLILNEIISYLYDGSSKDRIKPILRKTIWNYSDIVTEKISKDKIDWYELNTLQERVVNILDILFEAKTKLPKVIIIRILRNSTFDTVVENLKKAMQENRYK